MLARAASRATGASARLHAARAAPLRGLCGSGAPRSGSLGLEDLPPPAGTHHTIFNQSVKRTDVNFFTGDTALREATEELCSGPPDARLAEYGAFCGSEAAQTDAQLAHKFPPSLQNYDRSGNRVDFVQYHEAYHRTMGAAIEARVPSLAWGAEGGEAATQVQRAALAMMHYELEPGSSCPATMTFAAVPPVRASPAAAEFWLPKLLSNVYDPRNVPASEKEGVVFGMSMTEAQGGSDVRSNTTRATPLTSSREDGSGWSLQGAKWFTSAPNSDAFLTLAQSDKGLSCFLVPRWLPDGRRNSGFRVMQLKDKLGDRSNASSEVEYDNAWGQLVGREGKGIATIMEMVAHTRLDCALGSAGLMRQAVRMAVSHCSQRSAFGSVLVEAPLMRAVLADLAMESEASVLLSMRLAAWFDAAARGEPCVADAPGSVTAADHSPEQMRALSRLATAISKFLICKRAPGVAVEALECHGGNGYDDRWEIERVVRQSPLNSIWEGSGNVQALDILRTCAKEPEAMTSLLRELSASAGDGGSAYASRLAAVSKRAAAAASDPASIVPQARAFAESLGTLLQAHLLTLKGNDQLSGFFADTRLSEAGAVLSAGVGPNQPFGSRVPRDTAAADALIARAVGN